MSSTPDTTRGPAAGPVSAPAGMPPAGRSARTRPLILDSVPLSIGLALVFVVAGLVSLLMRGPTPAAFRPDDSILIALTIATGLALALLWWSPLWSLSIIVSLLVVQSIAGYNYTWAAVMAAVVASFVTVLFDEWRRAVAGGFVVTGGFVLLWLTGTGISWQELAARWITLSAVWSLACVLRIYRASAVKAERRAELFAADRDARARDAVAQERARMARELHDSVGHALNVVVLHAGAAQRVVATKPELVQQALDNIETAGRQALGDIERMLGILRAGDEEVCCDADPGVDQIEELCDQVRDAGLPVELAVEGEIRELPSSLDLTAYRIVQESLTNTLKHAGRTHAQVKLDYGPDWLGIDVLDEGRGVAAGASVGGGRGLLGMRERVMIFGGELQAGPRAEGGFAVHARLPLRKEGQ